MVCSSVCVSGRIARRARPRRWPSGVDDVGPVAVARRRGHAARRPRRCSRSPSKDSTPGPARSTEPPSATCSTTTWTSANMPGATAAPRGAVLDPCGAGTAPGPAARSARHAAGSLESPGATAGDGRQAHRGGLGDAGTARRRSVVESATRRAPRVESGRRASRAGRRGRVVVAVVDGHVDDVGQVAAPASDTRRRPPARRPAGQRGLDQAGEHVVGAGRDGHDRHVEPALGHVTVGAVAAEHDARRRPRLGHAHGHARWCRPSGPVGLVEHLDVTPPPRSRSSTARSARECLSGASSRRVGAALHGADHGPADDADLGRVGRGGRRAPPAGGCPSRRAGWR